MPLTGPAIARMTFLSRALVVCTHTATQCCVMSFLTPSLDFQSPRWYLFPSGSGIAIDAISCMSKAQWPFAAKITPISNQVEILVPKAVHHHLGRLVVRQRFPTTLFDLFHRFHRAASTLGSFRELAKLAFYFPRAAVLRPPGPPPPSSPSLGRGDASDIFFDASLWAYFLPAFAKSLFFNR